MQSPVQPTRIRALNERAPRRGRYVLYWMQQSQRAVFNPALEHAVFWANELGLPLVTGFGLMPDYPEATLRAYRFMVEGLIDAHRLLARRGVPLVVRLGAPDEVALELSEDAALLVCDRGYLRHQKQWRASVAKARCPGVQVEGDVVVPVEVASGKAEYAARTLRPKLRKLWDEYLQPLKPVRLLNTKAPALTALKLSSVEDVLSLLKVDASVPPVHHLFQGGSTQARAQLRRFCNRDLPGYRDARAHAELPQVSHLGKYLHFGHISPVEVALAARHARVPQKDIDSFLEELIVRRELAQNFVENTKNYDRYEAVPGWARATLAEHQRDARPHRYSYAELERATTHDPYWNAAMRELRFTGYLHNALRMYWGKKILEWSGSAEEAHATALSLNNRYLLDGRDPNSYANIGWLFGLHDRPWPQRPIYGTVRSMAASGLERKMDIEAYVRAVDRRVAEAQRAGVSF